MSSIRSYATSHNTTRIAYHPFLASALRRQQLLADISLDDFDLIGRPLLSNFLLAIWFSL